MSGNGQLRIDARGERELVITRQFNAPRTLVFEALTQPALLKRWLGVFGGWELAVCEMDLRVGGRYRWVWRRAGAAEMGMSGVYREITPPERIVSTELFDNAWYPGEAVGTTVLTEDAGRTTMTLTMLYASREARDGVLASPMESGMAQGYNALDAVLASLETDGTT